MYFSGLPTTDRVPNRVTFENYLQTTYDLYRRGITTQMTTRSLHLYCVPDKDGISPNRSTCVRRMDTCNSSVSLRQNGRLIVCNLESGSTLEYQSPWVKRTITWVCPFCRTSFSVSNNCPKRRGN